MIHINGRHPIAKMGYLEVGKQIGISLGHIDTNSVKVVMISHGSR